MVHTDWRILPIMGDGTHRPTAAVIGLGRFGRFWAATLSGRFQVCGTSRRVQGDLPTGVAQVALSDAARCDFVFLTVAISAVPAVLDELAPLLGDQSTVIDTCSVKEFPVREMEARLPEHVGIIATHPMFGPDSAREREDALPVITWPVRDRHQRYHALIDAFRAMNMRIEEMSPADHDREAAFSQGVTHLVGRILSEMALQDSGIATLGYTRLLQVMEQTCNDPVELFQDLQNYNVHTREMRQRFSRAMDRVEEILEEGRGGPMHS